MSQHCPCHPTVLICRAALVSVLLLARPALADSWADQIITYDPGDGAQEGYTDPSMALGSPERYTGEGTAWPGAVTPFNPAWLTTEVVSLGEGGHLTVLFDDPTLFGSEDAGVVSETRKAIERARRVVSALEEKGTE